MHPRLIYRELLPLDTPDSAFPLSPLIVYRVLFDAVPKLRYQSLYYHTLYVTGQKNSVSYSPRYHLHHLCSFFKVSSKVIDILFTIEIYLYLQLPTWELKPYM
jgi:hypothetical protein